ncbi:MAG: hypothetical protein IJH79_04230 [Lentisphaeria bacterium]|nr:hypothetical protein [Lentisphaeria bacterium]
MKSEMKITKERVKIRKNGTVEIGIVEANPICFKGRLYLFESIRTGEVYCRFLEPATGWTSPEFGHGLCMANAFVREDRIYVTAVKGSGTSRFYQLESDDMVHWTEPRVILEGPGWAGYNTSICRDGSGFLLTFELGKPEDLVHVPFTMFFARSTDLKEWKVIPDAVFGRDIYTGGPMLRHFGDWYYFFYLDGSYEKGFRESVARSRDLKNWEWSPRNPILDFSDDDRKLHSRFSDEEQELIRSAEDINNSDMDMCEWDGKLFIVYSWGNQRGTEFLAFAEAEGTEKSFCESWFDTLYSDRQIKFQKVLRMNMAVSKLTKNPEKGNRKWHGIIG